MARAVYTGGTLKHWQVVFEVPESKFGRQHFGSRLLWLPDGLKSQDIRRLELDDAGRVIDQHAIRIGQRVRDVRQGPDGLLYVITDEPRGSLIRIAPTADSDAPEPP